MPEETHAPPVRLTYTQKIHRPLNCLMFILPLLVFSQIGTAWYGTDLFAPQDLCRLLRYFGVTGAIVPSLVIGVVLMAQHVVRRDRWGVDFESLLGMLAESILWVAPLWALNHLIGLLQAEPTQKGARHAIQELLRAIGAGVYEEFLFRLVFIGLVMLLLIDVIRLRKGPAAAGAVLVSALLFSLYHFYPVHLANLPWRSFAFKAMAGAYLGGLFLLRGFGVAVGTHAAYNIYLFLGPPHGMQ